MKLVTVAQMKAIEAEADAGGLTYKTMMANAGRSLANAVIASYSFVRPKKILGLVGSGNNGGDTLVALAQLANAGWTATGCLVTPRDPMDALIQQVNHSGGRVVSLQDDTGLLILDNELSQSTVILDGILGTGVTLPLREDLQKLLIHIQDYLMELPNTPHIIAVDCPSGVDCDTGEADANCLRAERTVCMAAVKAGLVNFPAASLCGQIEVVDIGIPEGLRAWQSARDRIADAGLIKSMLPPRRNDAHKGTFGTVTAAAGSVNYTGAALLAGKAAYLVGTGLVCLAVPQPLHVALAGQLPETTWLPLPHVNGAISSKAAPVLADNLQKTTVLLIGPGLGSSETTLEFLKLFLQDYSLTANKIDAKKRNFRKMPPMVIDADGLNLLSRIPDWPDCLPEGCVLTPHPGEMAGLTGLSIPQIQERRIETAREWSEKWNQVVVLKGAYTVIASPKGRATINQLATASLARAGTGDVLAGMTAGFLAQGIPAEDAACAAVYLHGRAALAARSASGSSASVLASDVLNKIGTALQEINW